MDNANSGIRRTGLGMVPATPTTGDELNLVRALDYTPFEEVDSATPASVNTDATAVVPVQQTMVASSALTLPKFDFSTSVASCNDCTTTSSAVATNLNTSVVPLPTAPKTTNWLLIAACAAVCVVVFHGKEKPGLGAPEPLPTPEPKTLGRPPRKPQPKASRHVAEVTIS